MLNGLDKWEMPFIIIHCSSFLNKSNTFTSDDIKKVCIIKILCLDYNNNNKALFQAHMAHKMNTNVCKNTQCASGLCHR